MKLTREEIEGYRKFLRGITNPDGWVDALCDAALQSLSQEAVRDEALEEAARVVWVDGEKPCETWTDSQTGKPTFDPIQVSRMQLAAAILALKREPNNVLAPGERKPGEIAGPRNDAAGHGVASEEQVSNPVEDTNKREPNAAATSQFDPNPLVDDLKRET